MRLVLDHTIVGQELTTLTIRKDREWAGCRICGATFQANKAIKTPNDLYTREVELEVAIETREWRTKHAGIHSSSVHESFQRSGRTFAPDAALKLAPFGIVPIEDASDPEVAQALLEASRAPFNDVETTLRGWY